MSDAVPRPPQARPTGHRTLTADQQARCSWSGVVTLLDEIGDRLAGCDDATLVEVARLLDELGPPVQRVYERTRELFRRSRRRPRAGRAADAGDR